MLCRTRIHRPEFAGGNVRFYSFHKSRAAAARRKITMHLPVPIVHILLEEPSRQGSLIIRWQASDRFLNGVQGHDYQRNCFPYS